MISERSVFLHLLRILSATLVCVGHAKEFFLVHRSGEESIFEDVLRGLMSLGGASVLVFFFLSGFLVGGNEIGRARSGRLRPRKYLLDRLTRLWLVLFPALFLTIGLNSLTCKSSIPSLYCSADTSLSSHAYVAPLESQSISNFLGNLLFLQPFHTQVFGGNGPLWSLSYEFWYYIIFYALLLLIYSKRNGSISRASVIILVLACVGLSIISLNWVSLSTVWISGALASRLIGHLDSNLLFRRGSFFARHKFPKLLVFFVFPALIFPSVFPRYIAYPCLVILLWLSIVFTCENDGYLIDARMTRLIVLGSEISFSLYLIHFPLLALLASKFTPSSRWNLDPKSFIFIFLVTFFCLVSSYAFAFFTELKLQAFRKKMGNFYSSKNVK